MSPRRTRRARRAIRRARTGRSLFTPAPLAYRNLARERLEPRTLLAADGMPAVMAPTDTEGLDLLVRVDPPGKRLQLVDLDTGSVIQQSSVESTATFLIQGSAGADRLRIDAVKKFSYAGIIRFDAGEGLDRVLLESQKLDELELSTTDDASPVLEVRFDDVRFHAVGLDTFRQQGTVAAVELVGTDRTDAWNVFQVESDRIDVTGVCAVGSAISFQTPDDQLTIDTSDGDDVVSVVSLELQRTILAIQGGDGGDGGDDIRVLDNLLNRSELLVQGGPGADHVALQGNRLTRSEVTVDGGDDRDSLAIIGNTLERSSLQVWGGGDGDTIDVDDDVLDRSELSVRGASQQQSSNDPDDDVISLSGLILRRSSAHVQADGGDDVVSIDGIDGDGLTVDGGDGFDELRGPLQGANWTVSGSNQGTLNQIAFQRFEQLRGADQGEDTFVVENDGAVDGAIFGGIGPGDLLRRNGDDGGDAVQTLISPMVAVSAGGTRAAVEHHGFETVIHEATPDDQTVDLDDGSNVRLSGNSDGGLTMLISYAFDAVEDAADLSGGDGALVSGDRSGAMVGTSVASAGDVNGDGFEDLIVGAAGDDRAYVLFGGADGIPSDVDLDDLDAAEGFVLIGPDGSMTGASVDAAGDINGDSWDDLIVGGPGIDTVYVVFGGDTGFPDSIELADLDGTDGIVLVGASGDQAGLAVSAAGDVNGDLMDDVIVGAPAAVTGSATSGRIFVLFGASEPIVGPVDLTALDADSGLIIDGLADGDRLGAAVDGARDLNADGVMDFAAGAPGADQSTGAAYLILGQAAGFDDPVDLSSLTSDTGFVVSGSATGDQAGASVALIADIQGDRLNELVVTAPGPSSALILFGTTAGYPDVVTFDSADGTNGFIADATGQSQGGRLVATDLGDLNGDGVGDLALGVPDAVGATDSGSVMVVLSNPLVGSSGVVLLDDLAGDDGFRLDGVSSGDSFGTSVGAGDFDGDGLRDLVAGATGAANDAGQFAVLRGRSDGGTPVTHIYQMPTQQFSIDGVDSSAVVTFGATSSTSDGGDEDDEDQDVATDGADFSVDVSKSASSGADDPYASARSPGRIEIDGVAIVTTSADVTTAGDIDLTAGRIDVLSGSTLDATADAPGDIELLAKNVVDETEIQLQELFNDFVHLQATVSIAGNVSILGGQIDIRGDAGDKSLESSSGQAVSGIDFGTGGEALEGLDLPAQLIALPISIFYKRSTTQIDVGDETGEPVTIQGAGDVTILSKATSLATGEALWWYNATSLGGAAVTVMIVDGTSRTRLYDGVSIQSQADVDVESNTSTTTTSTARVSANSGKDFPEDPANVAIAAGIAVVNPTAHVTVDPGAAVTAAGDIKVDASATDTLNSTALGTIYRDGRGAIGFTWTTSEPDVKTLVNGSLTSSSNRDGAEQLSFDPMTDIDWATDLIDVGTEVVYETGDEFVYDPGYGGAVDGLTRRQRVFAISVGEGLIKLAATSDEAKQGIAIDLLPEPSFVTQGGTVIGFTTIEADGSSIRWDFSPGFEDGDAVAYQAVVGKELRGLGDGETYYAIATSDENTFQWAASPGGPAIDLNPTPYFSVDTGGALLDVETFDDDRGVVTFNQPHGLSSGDAIVLHTTLGVAVTDPLSDDSLNGQTFYAIPAPDEDDPDQLDPTQLRLAATMEDALLSDGFSNSVDFETDVVVTTGDQHGLDPWTSAGITVGAEYTGSHKVENKANIGKDPIGTDAFKRVEMWGNISATIDSGLASLSKAVGLPTMAAGSPDIDTSPDLLEASAAANYWSIGGQVQSIVGSQAVLRSTADVAVRADSTEQTHATAEGKVSNGQQGGSTVVLGGAVTIGSTDLTVQAVVNGGAQVDASDTLTVEAQQQLPFLAPFDHPSQFDQFVVDQLKEHPTHLDGLNDNLPFLEDLVVNNWTRATTDLKNSTADFSVTVQQTIHRGTADAIIAAGALVNQDPDYRTDDQTVDVNARSTLDVVDVTGVFNLDLSLAGLIKAATKGSPSNAYSPVGTSGEQGGLGFSLSWVEPTLHTRAAVGIPSPVNDDGSQADSGGSVSPARVETGGDGRLSIDSHTDVFAVLYAQAGASNSAQNSYGFAGGVGIYEQTTTTHSVLGTGTVVGGGSLTADATDSTMLVSLAGDVNSGSSYGIGASVNVVTVDRTTEAYIGDPDGTSTTGVDLSGLAPSADINLSSTNTGFVYALSVGGDVSVDSGTPPDETGNWRDDSGTDANERDLSVQQMPDPPGPAPSSGSFGTAISGDAAFVQLHDVTRAFIDDPSTIAADDVTITSLNDTNAGALSGSLAIINATASSALSGSYSEVNLHENETQAYVARAQLVVAGSLALDAKRLGNVWSSAASAGGDARGSGIEMVGSASFVSANQSTKAWFDGATISLADDATMDAKDNLTIINVAGGLDYGGRVGVGGAYAVTKIEADVSARATDSAITQSAGSLSLTASMGEKGTVRAATVGGSGGGGAEEVVDDTTIAVVTSNADRQGATVDASLDDSSYTHTGVGDLNLTATDDTAIQTGAGAVSADAKVPVGVAVADNFARHVTMVAIDQQSVSLADGDVNLNALNNVEAGAYALGLAAAGQSADVAGSAAANELHRRATARILDAPSIDVSGDISVHATLGESAHSWGQVVAGAGAFGLPGANASAALGAAVAVNLLDDHVEAHVSNSAVTADDVELIATNSTGAVLGVAAGLEGAESFADGGSVVTNDIVTRVEAHVDEQASIDATGDVDVKAVEQGTHVVGTAGEVSSSAGAEGVESFGAGVVENHVHGIVDAFVRGASVSGDSVDLTATRENAFVSATALGGANSTNFAAGAAVANQDVTHTTRASVSEQASVSGATELTVEASESGSRIIAAAGEFAAGKASIGAAGASNELTNTILAIVGSEEAKMTEADGSSADSSSGSVDIRAKSGDSFQLAIAVGGEGASNFAAGGSVAVNDNTRTIDAHVANADASADSDLTIESVYENATVTATAGNVDIQYSGQMSGGSGTGTEVDGRGGVIELVEISAQDGAGVVGQSVDDSLSEFDEDDDVLGDLNTLRVDENGEILSPVDESDDSPVPDPDPVGDGVGSFGAAAAVNDLDDTITASIINASATSSSGDVSLTAETNDLAVAVAGAGSGATQSTLTGAAAGSVNDVTRTTEAKIDGDGGQSTVDALGNVIVDADSLSHVVTVAGNAAITSDSSSVGVSTAVLDRDDTTRAIVDDARVEASSNGAVTTVDTGIDLKRAEKDDFRGISVEATSREVLSTVAAGFSGGTGPVDVSANVSVSTTTDHTEARALPGAVLSTGEDTQDFNIFADNDLTVQGGGGALGIGSEGTFGVGISSDGGSITTVTEAQLAPSLGTSIGDMTVQSLSSEQLASWEGTVEVQGGTAPEVAGTIGVHLLDVTTRAYVGADDGSTTAELYPAGSLLIAADDQLTANYLAGDVSGDAQGANFGVAIGYAHATKTVEAFIDALTTVVAFGEPDANDDLVDATTGELVVSYDDSTDDPSEVQPPGNMVPDPGDTGAGSPVDDPALTQVRHAEPKFSELQGVAVTATSRDVVKGVSFSAGAAPEGGLETSSVVRTGGATTRAYVAGDVTVDGVTQEIRIVAAHDAHLLTVAGGATIGGDLTVTASLGWSAMDYTTEAYVDQGASLTSNGDVTISAGGAEHLTAVVAGFDIGAAGFDASVGFVSINNTVSAWVDSHAIVDAQGNVAVVAGDNTSGTTVVGGVGIGAPGLAVGAGFVEVDIVKQTRAELRDEATVTGRGNSDNLLTVLEGDVSGTTVATKQAVGVAVQASSSENLTNVSFAGGGGELAGIAGAGTYTHVNSDTTALIGNGAAVNGSLSGAVDQQAVGVGASNVADVENWAGGLGAGTVFIGGAVDVGIVRNDTTATVGSDALVKSRGDIDVFAVSARKAESRGLSAGAGLAGIAGAVSVWTLGREVSTQYTTGASDSASNGTTGDALSLYGSPGWSSYQDHGDAQADRGDLRSALSSYSSGTAGSVSSGNATLAAIAGEASGNLADATPSQVVSTAMSDSTESSTTAEILETTDVGGIQAGADLSVSAQESSHLDVQLGGITVGVVGVGASVGVANVHGGATAAIGGQVTAGGNVSVDAGFEGNHSSHAYVGAIDAFAAIGASVAVIDDDAAQLAYVDDGASVASADSLTVTATRQYTAFDAVAEDGELGGLAAAGAAVAKSNARGGTEAWIGDASIGGDGQVSDVTVMSMSVIEPKANATALAAGVGAGEGNRADALVTPKVDAHLGSGTADGSLDLTGDLKLTAQSTTQPSATGNGVSAGALAVGVSQVTAESSPAVSAYVAEQSSVEVDNLIIDLLSVGDDPHAMGTASAGGLVTGSGVDATAKILTTIDGYIGAGAQVTAVGDVEIQIDHASVGEATATGDDFGALTVADNGATLTVKPVVKAYIAAEQVDAGGAILVKAHSGVPGTFPELDFSVSQVDYDTNTIVFQQAHGLQTGDFITYDSQGGAPVGGLEDGQTYPVIVVNETAIQLGTGFQQDAVDPDAGTVQFSQGHSFDPGDAIIYDANMTEPLGGVTSGTEYWTNLLDPYNVKLAASQDVAENLQNFRIADIDIIDSTLSLGAVFQPSPIFEMVTKKDDHHMTPVGADPGWATGTAVLYVPGPGDQLIVELLQGGIPFYVSASSSGDQYHLVADKQDAINGEKGIKYDENADGYFLTLGDDLVPTSPWMGYTDPTECPDCLFLDVDNDNDIIYLDPNAPFSDGDIVTWSSSAVDANTSLSIPDQLWYVADVQIDSATGNKEVRLAVSQDAKNAGDFVNIQGTGDVEALLLGKPFVISTGDFYTYRAPVELQFTSADINPDGTVNIDTGGLSTYFDDTRNVTQLVYDVRDTSPGAVPLSDLTPGQTYAVGILDGEVEDSITVQVTGITLTPSGDENDVNPTEHVFRIPLHDPIFGLNDGDTYYLLVDVNDPGNAKLAASPQDAAQGEFLDIGVPMPTVQHDSFSDPIEDVGSSGNSVLLTNAPNFETGDAIVYSEVTGRPITGLTDGTEYYAIVLSGSQIRFAVTNADAQAGNAIELDFRPRFSGSYWVNSVSQGDDVLTLDRPTALQTGDQLVYEGGFGDYIVGLEIGRTYYVILPDGSDGSQILLSETLDGATSSDGSSHRAQIHTRDILKAPEGTHYLSNEGLSVTPSSSQDTQYLIYDLTDNGDASGTHGFQQTGTTDEFADGQPKLKAAGSDGNLAGALLTSATGTIEPTVQAFLGDPGGESVSVTMQVSASDLVVDASTDLDLTAESTGYDLSVLVGGASAEANVTTNATTQSWIGAGAVVKLSGSSSVTADLNETLKVNSDATGGGAIDSLSAKSVLDMDATTITGIGAGTTIQAGGTNQIGATTSTSAKATAKGHPGGVIVNPESTAKLTTGKTAGQRVTEVTIGDGADLSAGGTDQDGHGLRIFATIDHGTLYTHATSRSSGAIEDANSDSEVTADELAKISLGANVQRTDVGTSAVQATMKWDKVKSYAESRLKALAGETSATADATVSGGTNVSGTMPGSGVDYVNAVTHGQVQDKAKAVTRELWHFKAKGNTTTHSHDDTAATGTGASNSLVAPSGVFVESILPPPSSDDDVLEEDGGSGDGDVSPRGVEAIDAVMTRWNAGALRPRRAPLDESTEPDSADGDSDLVAGLNLPDQLDLLARERSETRHKT